MIPAFRKYVTLRGQHAFNSESQKVAYFDITAYIDLHPREKKDVLKQTKFSRALKQP